MLYKENKDLKCLGHLDSEQLSSPQAFIDILSLKVHGACPVENLFLIKSNIWEDSQQLVAIALFGDFNC